MSEEEIYERDMRSVYDRVAAKEVPADIIYEDDATMAFTDFNPTTKKSYLVIPKKRNGLYQLSLAKKKHKGMLGHLMVTAAKVARKMGLDKTGFRTVINDGNHGCQYVHHLSVHVIGG